MAPVPQLALELIGRHRIVGKRDLSQGYNNRVWRVACSDGAVLVVKRFRSPWLLANERAAIAMLGPMGLAPRTLTAQGASFLIWPDDGDASVSDGREGQVRATGFALSRLHGVGPVDPADTDEDPSWRSVNRIAAAAAARSGFRADPTVAVHGDPWPGNVLIDPLGRFKRFCDFEEFGPGDAMADLMLARVEHACAAPWQAEDVCRWLWDGYAAGPAADGLSRLSDPEVRHALAEETLSYLESWARGNDQAELVARLSAGRDAALSGVVQPGL